MSFVPVPAVDDDDRPNLHHRPIHMVPSLHPTRSRSQSAHRPGRAPADCSVGAIQYGKDQYITAVVVGLFVIHPNIVEQTLKLFNCVSLASQPGYTYLVADMHERCWSGDHLKYALGVGLPSTCSSNRSIPTC